MFSDSQGPCLVVDINGSRAKIEIHYIYDALRKIWAFSLLSTCPTTMVYRKILPEMKLAAIKLYENNPFSLNDILDCCALQSPILGYLWDIWILWFKGTSSIPISMWYIRTIPIPFYHTIPCYLIPYQVTSYHTKWLHTTIPKLSQGVWCPFSIYIYYFCRLQYWSIGCHFLWPCSSCFSSDIKLQMEAI